MSTPDLDKALSGLPAVLRSALVKAYGRIKSSYVEQKWETSSLNGGKLSEVAYRVLEWHTKGSFTPLGQKIPNFEQACRNLANADKARFPESVRLTIPRVLIALYDIRNKRGVGHVGGDIDENRMDATVVTALSDWVIAEFVRLFHGISVDDAQKLVDALTTKALPVVWTVGDRRRVLDPKLGFREQTLLILYYAFPDPLSDSDLVADVEYSNPSRYRSGVLKQLHKERLVEYSKDGNVRLSPTGRCEVEQKLLTPAAGAA